MRIYTNFFFKENVAGNDEDGEVGRGGLFFISRCTADWQRDTEVQGASERADIRARIDLLSLFFRAFIGSREYFYVIRTDSTRRSVE